MLVDRIKARTLDDHKKLTADGKLPSSSQLEVYYRTFRSRFGPDELARLDGEDLLEAMHSLGNKDSLVYWLEFKSDEEFPARIFGSIAGGSAFKFGVFRRKETRTWVTTDEGNNPRDISVGEAVVIARKHRDQLLRGVDHLWQLRPDGDDAAYRRLQALLEKDPPICSEVLWSPVRATPLHYQPNGCRRIAKKLNYRT